MRQKHKDTIFACLTAFNKITNAFEANNKKYSHALVFDYMLVLFLLDQNIIPDGYSREDLIDTKNALHSQISG